MSKTLKAFGFLAVAAFLLLPVRSHSFKLPFGSKKPAPAPVAPASAAGPSAAAKPASPTAKLREVIYFSSREQGRLCLGRLNADGTGKAFLSQERQSFVAFPPREKGDDWSPCLSPDGKNLAFYSDRDGAANLWIMAPDGYDQRPLTREDTDIIPMRPRVHSTLAFSPDSRKLAYLRGGDVWIYDFNTQLQTSLTQDHGVEALAWSPDGKSMAFVRNDSLFVTRLGSPLVQLLASNSVGWPALQFEPKAGKQVLFFQQGAWTVSVDDRSLARLYSSLVVPNTLAYSPDGKSICILAPSPEHRAEVFLVGLDGKGSQLTQGGAEDCFFNAAGNKVYFLRRHKLWVIGTDSKGARPLTQTRTEGPVLGQALLPAEAL
jgi:WD40 repeat protein